LFTFTETVRDSTPSVTTVPSSTERTRVPTLATSTQRTHVPTVPTTSTEKTPYTRSTTAQAKYSSSTTKEGRQTTTERNDKVSFYWNNNIWCFLSGYRIILALSRRIASGRPTMYQVLMGVAWDVHFSRYETKCTPSLHEIKQGWFWFL